MPDRAADVAASSPSWGAGGASRLRARSAATTSSATVMASGTRRTTALSSSPDPRSPPETGGRDGMHHPYVLFGWMRARASRYRAISGLDRDAPARRAGMRTEAATSPSDLLPERLERFFPCAIVHPRVTGVGRRRLPQVVSSIQALRPRGRGRRCSIGRVRVPDVRPEWRLFLLETRSIEGGPTASTSPHEHASDSNDLRVGLSGIVRERQLRTSSVGRCWMTTPSPGVDLDSRCRCRTFAPR